MVGFSQTDGRTKRNLGARPSIDVWLVLATCCILTVGLMAIFSYSVSHHEPTIFRKQLIFLVTGFGPFAILAFTRLEFLKKSANFLYVLNLVCLVAVLLIGKKGGDASRWINIGFMQFQPSELCKLILAITLSSFYANRKDSIHKFRTFALSFLHVLIPLVLVFKQPHLGASLAILVTWLGVSIYAGVPWRNTLGALIAAVSLLTFAFTVPGVLSPYQKERVVAFLGLSGSELRTTVKKSRKDMNWQQDQAKIAFAAGGTTGTGYMKGEQSAGDFIPEQHNDFIFTIVGEEGGLVACSMVLAGFGFFFYRAWLIMFRAIDPFVGMLAAGVLAFLAFHTVANVGMNLSLLPVVGLWLPFMSYGGTALWLCMACVGLLLNVSRQENRIIF